MQNYKLPIATNAMVLILDWCDEQFVTIATDYMANAIDIAGQKVGEGLPTFMIAELGGNLSGVGTAVEMIDVAVDAGADAVKFQTYKAETITSPDACFTLEDGSKISQYEYFKKYELSEDDHETLKSHCERRGTLFFSTPSHANDVDFLEDLGVSLYKTGSDDLTNYPLLKYIAGTGKPMIVTTGRCSIFEIEMAVRTILETGNDQLILLHCIVGYPVQINHANLNIIKTLQNSFEVLVGFSAHTRGTLAALLSVAMGAVVVEKHLTMDRSVGGPDNDVACEPEELKALIDDVRAIPTAMGSSVRLVYDTEKKWREAARKSIVATGPIREGTTISSDMLIIRRPSTGLHPRYLDMVVGRKASKDIAAGEAVVWEMIA